MNDRVSSRIRDSLFSVVLLFLHKQPRELCLFFFSIRQQRISLSLKYCVLEYRR